MSEESQEFDKDFAMAAREHKLRYVDLPIERQGCNHEFVEVVSGRATDGKHYNVSECCICSILYITED